MLHCAILRIREQVLVHALQACGKCVLDRPEWSNLQVMVPAIGMDEGRVDFHGHR